VILIHNFAAGEHERLLEQLGPFFLAARVMLRQPAGE
jgi:hypothetical protein